MTGIFITIEGGEGAGKSSLLRGLQDSLEKSGTIPLMTREPGGVPLAESIRSVVLDGGKDIADRTELLLFLAARAQHVEELVLPALSSGQTVICDRYSDSTIAYQGYARGMGPDIVWELCNFASDGLWPSLTFLLDITAEEGLRRSGCEDRMEAESLDFHKNVRNGFLDIAKRNPERFVILDATKPPEMILEQALTALHACEVI